MGLDSLTFAAFSTFNWFPAFSFQTWCVSRSGVPAEVDNVVRGVRCVLREVSVKIELKPGSFGARGLMVWHTPDWLMSKFAVSRVSESLSWN